MLQTKKKKDKMKRNLLGRRLNDIAEMEETESKGWREEGWVKQDLKLNSRQVSSLGEC